ncbi:MAG: cytochrome c oxidase subunit 4 [Chloroflexota bacterium]|nr:cytochrome c oxidase subunit 4 [Chloroflexota bacterium]
MPEEMRFLLRAGGYGVGIGVVYWVLAAEPAGTILLIGFGLASLALLGLTWWERRRQGRRLEGPAWRWLLLPPASANGGFTHEEGRLPAHSLAPLTAALGLSVLALALVFGPWLAVAAAIPLAVGVRDWIVEAMAEHRALAADTALDAAPAGSRRASAAAGRRVQPKDDAEESHAGERNQQ